MAAFGRICSGIPDMDQALDNIRLGDNVVWRVSNLQEFRYFCEPYIEQAIKDNRRIVYFRFASHRHNTGSSRTSALLHPAVCVLHL